MDSDGRTVASDAHAPQDRLGAVVASPHGDPLPVEGGADLFGPVPVQHERLDADLSGAVPTRRRPGTVWSALVA